MLSAGNLDIGFGGTGKVVADYLGTGGTASGAPGVALQADGKVLLAGNIGSGNPFGVNTNNPFRFGVERLNVDGSPDSSFGGGTGRVAITYPGIVDHFPPYVGSVTDLQVAPDGKIAVLMQIPGPDSNSQLVFAVARLNPDGTPDTSFSSDGFAAFRFIRIDLNPNLPADFDQARSLTIGPDGSIVVAGKFETGDVLTRQRDMMLLRIKDNGSLDTSFQNGPRLTSIPLESGLNLIDFTDAVGSTTETSDLANVVRVLADGSILVAGSTEVKVASAPPGGSFPDSYSAEDDFAVAKLRPDGSLDPSFGHGGRLTWNIRAGSWEAVDDMIVQPDGKIILIGRTSQADDRKSPDLAITRLNPDGTFDPSFDGDGVATFDLVGSSYPFQGEMPRSVLLRPDGKIVVVGSISSVTSTGFLLRLNADGSRDATYGTNGLASFGLGSTNPAVPSPGGISVFEAVLQPDGKVVGVAADQSPGASNANFAFRIVADSSLPPTGGGGTTGGGTTPPPTPTPPPISTPPPTPTPPPISTPPPTPTSPDVAPPRVVGVSLVTNRKTKAITGIVVQFSEAVDPTSATTLSHYDLRPTTRKAKPLRLKLATYDATTHAVTLTAAGKLPSNISRRLTLQDITDLARNLLDGDTNGSAGGAYATVLRAGRKT